MKNSLEDLVQGEPVYLEDMLLAREQRQSIQQELLAHYQKPLVCFTLNIVGPIKVFPLTIRAFYEGVRLIHAHCNAWKFPIIHTETTQAKTGYEYFIIIDSDARTIKEMLCRLEESCSLGRLFDIDVIQVNYEKVSRTDLDLPERKCLLCDNPAFVCSRSRAHSIEKILFKACDIIQNYFAHKYADQISSIAMQSMLYEVSVTPKPGLVDRNNTGSHSDMDIFTFERSAVSLNQYFKEFVLCGISNSEKSPERIFKRIRPLGIQAEETMMAATDQINTHKGMIFSLGILCAALGCLYGRQIPYSRKAIRQLCEQMSVHLLDDFESITLENAKTHGEYLYAAYGIQGARGEAHAGYPTIFCIGVEQLSYYLEHGYSINDAGALTLLHIIAHFEDTNIIARSSYETMRQIQSEIRALVDEQNIAKSDYKKIIEELDQKFIQLNISPGGSADMLALSYFIYYIEKIDNKNI